MSPTAITTTLAGWCRILAMILAPRHRHCPHWPDCPHNNTGWSWLRGCR